MESNAARACAGEVDVIKTGVKDVGMQDAWGSEALLKETGSLQLQRTHACYGQARFAKGKQPCNPHKARTQYCIKKGKTALHPSQSPNTVLHPDKKDLPLTIGPHNTHMVPVQNGKTAATQHNTSTNVSIAVQAQA